MTRRATRVYSEEYRREAVRLSEARTQSLSQLARELGIHVETLRLWRRRLGAAPTTREAGSTPDSVPSLEEENRQLRRENARLLEEREILKKATAFFARDAR